VCPNKRSPEPLQERPKGLLANANGRMGLAHAGWSNKDQILALIDKAKIQ
jgi:hypothetical protein